MAPIILEPVTPPPNASMLDSSRYWWRATSIARSNAVDLVGQGCWKSATSSSKGRDMRSDAPNAIAIHALDGGKLALGFIKTTRQSISAIRFDRMTITRQIFLPGLPKLTNFEEELPSITMIFGENSLLSATTR